MTSTIFGVLLSTVCAAALACLSIYVYLSQRGDSTFLLSHMDRKLITWKHKAFFALAALGLFICLFAGAEAMLFWLPKRWGFVGDDGDFLPAKTASAIVFALVAGVTLVGILSNADEHKLEVRILRLTVHGYERISRATPIELARLKSEYSRRLDEAHEKAKRKHGEAYTMPYASIPIPPEGFEVRAYRELLGAIEARGTTPSETRS